jgi:hemerythrin
MEFITWNDSLSVGVKQFDDEHKELISLVNRLNQALQIGGKQKAMEDILGSLARYTEIHFRHEEYYMKLYDYPAMPAHRKEHDDLTSQVIDFSERLKTGKASFSIELLIFLRDWLTKHILGSDMAYREFFISKGV